ncbi:MAG: putative ribosome biogenesis GTPase RsgA [Planctomycetaceae bacterium]|nr:MAG: putative ribosome biogenesis GTPase RsgA [Planctomycetaceae bacterium]
MASRPGVLGKKKSNRKRKVRVALKKNRGKRARRGNLTQQARTDPERIEDIAAGERVSGKGDTSRYRTVIAAETEGGDLQIDVDLSTCHTGRVLSAIGQMSRVQLDDGRELECTVRQIVRSLARDQRNAVVTGDRVLVGDVDAETGVIERVEPRHGVLSRSSRHRAHVIVSNVDQLMVVVPADDLKPVLVDRFLVSAEQGEIASVLCINKIDLLDPAELVGWTGLYARLGYEVVLTSAETGAGISRLRQLLAERETVFAGQSGVGKSSLLNSIQPGLRLLTGEISSSTGKGRHVTRRTQLIELDGGGYVVDTPGIRQLALWDLIPEEIEGFFVEFRPFVALCHFPDCSHTHEEGCAVKRAVETELIHESRYASYLRIHAGEDLV